MVKKKLTELERRRLLRRYERNEDDNFHSENAVMLINRFGNPKQKIKAKKIYASHMKRGSITFPESKWFLNNGHVHYAKLIKPIKRTTKKKVVRRKKK